MKLFLDANVLFTAAYSPNGLSRGIISLAEAGCCVAVASLFALDEARRNLTLKAPDKIDNLEKFLPFLSLAPEPSPAQVAWAASLSLPAKDAPILAAAVACKADILVTGDRRDFGHLLGRIIEGVKVLTPRDAVHLLLEGTPAIPEV